MPNIKEIDLGFSLVENISPLKTIKNRDNIGILLRLVGTLCRDYSAIASNKNITWLETDVITKTMAAHLKKSYLEKLSLNFYLDENIAELEISTLKTVELWHANSTNLNKFKKCTNLKEVIVHNVAIEDISAVANMKKLESLHLNQSSIS